MKKLFPHIFVFFAFITLIFLGTWQVFRREEKEALIAKIERNINTKIINLADYKNIDSDEFKKMSVTGSYLYDKEFSLLNKPFNGKPGQYVITPLKEKSGQIILVNRGWAPTDKDYEKPPGKVTITAIIRAGQKLNAMGKLIILNNIPEKQMWFWLDLPRIYQTLGLPQKDYYLDLINETKSTSYPFALPAKIVIYNEHLIYIITWYSLALVLALVYYFRFWKK